MRFFTVQKLGPKRSLTPEGFLLCEDVPVARTGEMLYAAGEVPVEAGLDGLIRISRTPDEVFRDATMASCMGKDITLDHPEDFVDPSNYSGLTQGVMLNPRRSATEPDLLVADLLIKRPDAISAVQDEEIEEVSLGYEADYEQVSPGRGVQRNIVVNHVAIVPRGRCGPRCAIGDKEPEMKTKDSKPTKKRTWRDRLRTAFAARDEAAMEEALEESETADADEDDEGDEKKEPGQTGDALAQILHSVRALDKRMAKIEARDSTRGAARDADENEEESETNDDGELTEADPAKKVSEEGVENYTGDAAAHIMARAEILSPGIKLPTIDSRASTKDRAKALCSCQRKALDNAYQTEAGKAAIDPFLGGRKANFDTMSMASVHATFTGAAEVMRAKNNGGLGRAPGKVATRDFGGVKSAADINKANAEYWAARSGNK